MAAIRMNSRALGRVWGRRDIPGELVGRDKDEPIGEIWFEHPEVPDPELLVKYLFTAERLSIQVHPDDDAARARGYPRGKDECWLVLDAEPGAVIGLGLTREVAPAELRAAALDGSIEQLIDWREVRSGDFYYSPAGTIHAIGARISLIEVQQNLDLTYRLYDYGRPRELHLDNAVAVADPAPYRFDPQATELGDGRQVLVRGAKFVVERWRASEALAASANGVPLTLIPLRPDGSLDQQPLAPGMVWLADGPFTIGAGADLLACYPGAEPRNELIAA